MLVYHGTAAMHVEAIRRDGLRPLGGRVYVTKRPEIAHQYAAVSAVGFASSHDPRALIVMLEVDESTLDPDSILFAAFNMSCYVCAPVPPEAIRDFEYLEGRPSRWACSSYLVMARARVRLMEDDDRTAKRGS